MRNKIVKMLRGMVSDLDLSCITLVDDGILSSLDILQLISEIDDELDIVIPVTSIKPENFNSVDKIVSMLESIEK